MGAFSVGNQQLQTNEDISNSYSRNRMDVKRCCFDVHRRIPLIDYRKSNVDLFYIDNNVW